MNTRRSVLAEEIFLALADLSGDPRASFAAMLAQETASDDTSARVANRTWSRRSGRSTT